ncbi:MAG: ribosome silencing factor [Phycisphaerae bacterium]|nr:ribosome silencing factor [Phycisphaerae bacterium]
MRNHQREEILEPNENIGDITTPIQADPTSIEESRKMAIKIAQLADDRNCTNVVVLELSGISPLAQHFVIATGTSSPQIRSVADEIEVMGKHTNWRAYGKAGMQEGRWAIVDLVDIIVHVFDEEFRKFYDLELLWGDAPRIDWQAEPRQD